MLKDSRPKINRRGMLPRGVGSIQLDPTEDPLILFSVRLVAFALEETAFVNSMPLDK